MSVPPPGKQYGGVPAQAKEGRLAGPQLWRCMGRPPTVGHVRPEGRPLGGVGHLIGAASQVAERPAPQQQAEQPLEIPLRARSYAEAAKGPLDSLARAEFVYIRKGGAGSPTQPVYEGTYTVKCWRGAFTPSWSRWVIGTR
jgi:hypothetical protein